MTSAFYQPLMSQVYSYQNYLSSMGVCREESKVMDTDSHTLWRCPECGKRFGTWGNDPPISPCCNKAIDQECVDALSAVEQALRNKLLTDADDE